MFNEKTIVATIYGHDNRIEKIAISLFDRSYRNSNADTYCNTINELELKGDGWVYAKEIKENTPYVLNSFIPFKLKFSELMMKLDDRGMQKVLREFDSKILAVALKGEDDAVHTKAFQNMSNRASQMLKEDMEYLRSITSADIKNAQEKLISVVRAMIDTGEIINPFPDVKGFCYA